MVSIWENIKKEIKENTPDHRFRLWIEPLGFQEVKTNRLILSCPNLFLKKRILENYRILIETGVKKFLGNTYGFEIIISNDQNAFKNRENAFEQLTLPNIKSAEKRGRYLRKDFTFDQFVVGKNNDFAYSAALSLAAQKKVQQSSLFLLSKTGLGKSHLSQAIGHHIIKKFPGERVFYITAEDFTNEMVASFKSNSIGSFKEKYRKKCDVLLLEDVHYLTGKERTQLELAMALDSLSNSDKKIIFSSCYLPSDIPKLNDKLRSRLSCGLISNIEPPDYNTRVKILKKKSKMNGYHIPKEVISYLACELTDDVRQLKNGLIGVEAKASLLGSPINLELAESVVENMIHRCQRITIDSIKKMVSKYYNITIADIVSRSRKQAIVRPRQIAIYLSRRYTDQSLQVIGKSFNRYHATALYAIGTVEKGMKKSNQIKKQVEYLCKKIEIG